MKEEDDLKAMDKIMNTFDNIMQIGNQSDIRKVLNNME